MVSRGSTTSSSASMFYQDTSFFERAGGSGQYKLVTDFLGKTELNVLEKPAQHTVEIFDYASRDMILLLIIPYMICQPLFGIWASKTKFYEKNRDGCKKVMAFYNVVMAIFSLYCCAWTAYISCFDTHPTMIELFETFWGKSDRSSYKWDGIWGKDHHKNPIMDHLVWIFYLSKYVEFLDTYFLVLREAPVSWLQYWHHIGAPIGMSMLYWQQTEGAWIFVGFNGFIHTIMYYYYAACIMKWYCPFKQLITSMQLIQFVTGLSVFYAYPVIYPEHFWGNVGKRASWNFLVSYVLSLIVLFTNFALQNYVFKKPKSSKPVSGNGNEKVEMKDKNA